MRDSRSGLRVTRYAFRVAGFALQGASYAVRNAGIEAEFDFLAIIATFGSWERFLTAITCLIVPGQRRAQPGLISNSKPVTRNPSYALHFALCASLTL